MPAAKISLAPDVASRQPKSISGAMYVGVPSCVKGMWMWRVLVSLVAHAVLVVIDSCYYTCPPSSFLWKMRLSIARQGVVYTVGGNRIIFVPMYCGLALCAIAV